MNRHILINADDFGWTDGHNQAVALAHRAGALHRASLLCNGAGFGGAVRLAEEFPALQVGVHLTLNEGIPLAASTATSALARRDGSFYDGLYAIISLWLSGRLRTDEALPEWRAQIERAQAAGVRLTHIDSHKHIHILPPLLEAGMFLANEYGLAYMRCPLEDRPLRRGPGGVILWFLCHRAQKRLTSAGLRCADHFVGVGSSGKMRYEDLARAIQAARPGVTEIMVHPAIITPAVQVLQKKYAWAARYEFEGELQALLNLGS